MLCNSRHHHHLGIALNFSVDFKTLIISGDFRSRPRILIDLLIIYKKTNDFYFNNNLLKKKKRWGYEHSLRGRIANLLKSLPEA